MTEALALLSPDMSDAERRLVVATSRGEVADLGGAAIRPAVLRDLLLQSRRGWSMTPQGLRLSRAVVSGALDLTDGAVGVPVHFTDVTFEADVGVGLRVAHSRFARLSFADCRIAGAVLAEGAHFEAFELVESEAAGRLVLAGAHIHRTLRLDRTALGDGRNALDLTGADLGDGCCAVRAHLRGRVILTRVRLAGDLDMRDTALASPGIAVELGAAHIDGGVDLGRAHIEGAISAAHVSLAGSLLMQETVVAAAREGASGVALSNGVIGGNVDLCGARIEGAFDLSAAKISGRLAASGASLHGGSTAIAITHARIARDCDLSEAKLVGAAEAASCDIGGSLRISTARLFGARVAIDVSHGRIARDLDASRSVLFGTAELTRATIAGNLDLGGASLKVERGASLNARGMKVGGDCRLGSGFRSIGALVFDEATVQGGIALPESEIVAVSLAGEGVADAMAFDSHALSFVAARAGRLVMPIRANDRPRGIVDLARAEVDVFEDYAEAWPMPADMRKPGSLDHLVLDGFRYATLANPGGEAHTDRRQGAARQRARRVWQSRIAWLESQPRDVVSTSFTPDAWRTLAARLRQQGQAASARRIDIDRRRRTWRAASASRGERWRGRLLDVTVLYGYAPGRALVVLAGVAVLVGSVFAVLPQPCARPCAQSPFVAAPPAVDRTLAFSPWLYAADVVLPGLALGYETDWRIDPRWGGGAEGTHDAAGAGHTGAQTPLRLPAPGLALQAVALLGKIAGALLALLAAAGFAGLLRDET